MTPPLLIDTIICRTESAIRQATDWMMHLPFSNPPFDTDQLRHALEVQAVNLRQAAKLYQYEQQPPSFSYFVHEEVTTLTSTVRFGDDSDDTYEVTFTYPVYSVHS